MEKIPTLFVRGPDHGVTDEWHPDCLWVRDGEGKATEKLDGTNVCVEVIHTPGADDMAVVTCRLWKRYQPKDGDPGYVEATRGDPSNKHIFRALDATAWQRWEPGMHTCEAIGPKIQGNPLGLVGHPVLVRHDASMLDLDFDSCCDRTFEGIRLYLDDYDSVFSPRAANQFAPQLRMEGIVFHHPDGRMAKIKRKDYR